MMPFYDDWVRIVLAACVAFIVAFVTTPGVKRFAEHVGAIDVPKDGRRVHDHPIPRMGGLAIFMGFVLSVLLFVNMSLPVMGMLLGAVIIAVLGAVDDIVSLRPLVKLAGQILAAVVAIRCGLVFDTISNPNFFSQDAFIQIFNHVDGFEYRGEGSMKAWVTRIVVNHALKALRGSGRLVFVDDVPDAPEEEDFSVPPIPAAEIQKLIQALPDGYRAVFNLFVFEKKSHKEIAALLGIKEDSSASQFFRARALLARQIKTYIKEHDNG